MWFVSLIRGPQWAPVGKVGSLFLPISGDGMMDGVGLRPRGWGIYTLLSVFRLSLPFS